MTKKTTIQVLCTRCGEQALQPSALHLVVYDGAADSYFEFFCPSCKDLQRRPASKKVQQMLTTGGVRVTYEHVPFELLEHHKGPVLTEDDLLNFARELADTEDPALQAAIENAR